MNSKDQKAKEIFLQLISNVPPEYWEERVIAASAGDEDLRERVRALLRAHLAPDSLLDEPPPIDQSEPTLPLAAIEKTSAQIGPYKLLQQIGEGGMGVVYMAEQKVPVIRRVALKIIKPGMDTRQVIARFEAERQALAMMDHPNIAKVLDAGATDQGSPYFVMELVQGIPLTRYCDQNKLSISERLELFIPVCQAVQHAHQKGIIHRDLKPSNVLVCLYDGRPVAKVIDFGLAKALQQQTKLTDKTMFTEFGQVVGTLQYMSPEQAEMNQLDVDTRTDIYSLGVMLYELLTGSTPIDQETLKQQAILQVLAAIREKEPPRPSVRLGSSANDVVEGISQQRQIDPIKLQSILRGELDWIVMKALEKDRTRRYDTASNFAKDIENYLTGNIVTARPPSTAYRLRKYVSRHKGLVGSLASIAALLVAGIIGTSIGLYREREARFVADQASALADQKAEEVLAEKRKVESERTRAESEKVIAERERERSERTLARSNYFLARARWNENRVREANDLLDLVPPEYRNLEWYLSHREFRGGYMTCYGHQGSVYSVSFSPDGARIVSGGADGTVRLWDAATGAELQTIRGHADAITSVSFSPDAATVVSASTDETIRLWDSATGRELRTLIGHTVGVTSVSFNSDGTRIVSGGHDGTVRLWNAVTGGELQTLRGHAGVVTSVVFSPDAARIASASNDRTIRLWDSATGQELSKFEGHADGAESVCLSPDGTRIASGGFWGALKLWDAVTGQELSTLEGHRDSIKSVGYCPDGACLVSGGSDAMLKVWDATTGQELRSLKGHVGNVHSVCFSPDGTRIASASDDGTIKLWDVAMGQELGSQTGRGEGIRCIDVRPDGTQVVTGCSDGSLQLWDSLSGQELYELKGFTDAVGSVNFSPDGMWIVAGSESGAVKIWNPASGREVREVFGVEGKVTSVRFSPDSEKIIVAARGPVPFTLWDATTGQELPITTRRHSTFARVSQFKSLPFESSEKTVIFSPDGASIAAVDHGSDWGYAFGGGALTLWDAATGQLLRAISIDGVTSVNFSPDGARIAAGNYGAAGIVMNIWNAATGQQLSSFRAPSDSFSKVIDSSIASLSYSPDGTRIASASFGGALRLWDAATGEELLAFPAHADAIKSVNFTADGMKIISVSDGGAIRLWDATMSQDRRSLRGHANVVTSVSFSPDDQKIVSGSTDGTLRLWDVTTGEELITLNHGLEVDSVSFSQDGRTITSGSINGTFKQWDVASGQLIRERLDSVTTPGIISFSPDASQFVLTAGDGNLGLWNAIPGHELQRLRGHAERVTCSSFSPDGNRIVSGSDDRTLKLWRAATGRELHTLNGHADSIMSVRFSPGGDQIVSADSAGMIKLWDATKGKQIRTVGEHENGVRDLSISPAGDRVVSGGDAGSLKLWDVAAGQLLRTFEHAEPIHSVSFSPDGSLILSKGFATIKLWDGGTGKELHNLEHHASKRVNTASFSPDGKRVVSASWDGTLTLWDAATGKQLRESKVPEGEINHGGVIGIQFTDDGGRILAMTQSAVGFVWDITSDDLSDMDRWRDFGTIKTRSNDGRWLLTSAGSAVVLVDLEYKNQPFERDLRASKARLNPHWHRRQAASAPTRYAALFHLAWLMKHDPDDPACYDKLYEVHAQWLAEWDIQQNQTAELSAEESKDKNSEKSDPNRVLPPIVREMLSIARGMKESPD